jgi:hypothetical protein
VRSTPPPIPDADLLDAVPEALARRALALPVHITGGVLHVRTSPGAEDPTTLDELRMHAGAYDVVGEPHPDTVHHLLVAYARRALTGTGPRADPDTAPAAADAVGCSTPCSTSPSGARRATCISSRRWTVCVSASASTATCTTWPGSPPSVATTLVARTKVRAGLDVAERRLPQDGRFSHAVPGGSVDVRVATMPTRFGERVTLRLLPDGPMRVGLDALGLPVAALGGARAGDRRDRRSRARLRTDRFGQDDHAARPRSRASPPDRAA